MARYKDAIEWIALEDDTNFLDDADNSPLSVTATMVRDLWNKTEQQVRKDILAALARLEKGTEK